MSQQNLSISEKEEELIIKHQSMKKQSDFWGTFFLSISSFIILIAALAGSTSFWLFLVLISIASFSGWTILSKAKNNITVRVDKNHFLIEHNLIMRCRKQLQNMTFLRKILSEFLWQETENKMKWALSQNEWVILIAK